MATLTDAYVDEPIRLSKDAAEDERQTVIRAVDHLMESQ